MENSVEKALHELIWAVTGLSHGYFEKWGIKKTHTNLEDPEWTKKIEDEKIRRNLMRIFRNGAPVGGREPEYPIFSVISEATFMELWYGNISMADCLIFGTV